MLVKVPEAGDLVYGSILYLGKHRTLENKEGRIHKINDGTKAIFVFGNRYAPDYYEGIVPSSFKNEVDLLSRSGIIGDMIEKNSNIHDCTKVKVYGYIVDDNGKVLNTRNFSLLNSSIRKKDVTNCKMILCIGTAMNSGKSQAASRCCWALSSAGHKVTACKITGTASLKDILLMEDDGASRVADFTYMGYPSTYLIPEEDVFNIFKQLKRMYAPNNGYWVVEFADGILQKETALLLHSKEIRQQIHKIVFCAHDAVGIVGGLNILKQNFNLEPDIISGYCSSSPLAIQEFKRFTNLPVFDNIKCDLKTMLELLL